MQTLFDLSLLSHSTTCVNLFRSYMAFSENMNSFKSKTKSRSFTSQSLWRHPWQSCVLFVFRVNSLGECNSDCIKEWVYVNASVKRGPGVLMTAIRLCPVLLLSRGKKKHVRTTSHTFSLQRAYKEPLFSHKTIEVSKRIPTDSKCGSRARSGMRKCQKRCGSRAYTHAFRNAGGWLTTW